MKDKIFNKFCLDSPAVFKLWMSDFNSLGTLGHEEFRAIMDSAGNWSLKTISRSNICLFRRIIRFFFKPQCERINNVIRVALGKLKSNQVYLGSHLENIQLMKRFFYSGTGKEKEKFAIKYEKILAIARKNNISQFVIENAKKEAEKKANLILRDVTLEIDQLKEKSKLRISQLQAEVNRKADEIREEAENNLEKTLIRIETFFSDRNQSLLNTIINKLMDKKIKEASLKKENIINNAENIAETMLTEAEKEVLQIEQSTAQEIDNIHHTHPQIYDTYVICKSDGSRVSYIVSHHILLKQFDKFAETLPDKLIPSTFKQLMQERNIKYAYDFSAYSKETVEKFIHSLIFENKNISIDLIAQNELKTKM